MSLNISHRFPIWRSGKLSPVALLLQCGLFVMSSAPPPGLAAELALESKRDDIRGEAVYEYYCYQCHGYSGDGNTMAASFVQPKPRNFTSSSLSALSTERMIDAITNGRQGTVMVSFRSVLAPVEIAAVVAYIRQSFMSNEPLKRNYHTAENGWLNHQRYSEAFPFVDGSIGVGTGWQQLDAAGRRGKELYLSACITCHDQPNNADAPPMWELRAVSYPRRHFSHRVESPDFVSSASPYAKHDVPVIPDSMTTSEKNGLSHYLQNCAFCHAADGTGKNWIGSFLDPRPRDFTAPDFTLFDTPDALRERIRLGVENSSMPAWRSVLTNTQIDDLIRYMQAAFTVD